MLSFRRLVAHQNASSLPTQSAQWKRGKTLPRKKSLSHTIEVSVGFLVAQGDPYHILTISLIGTAERTDKLGVQYRNRVADFIAKMSQKPAKIVDYKSNPAPRGLGQNST